MAFNMYGESFRQGDDSFGVLHIVSDIDKNGRVDSKEMEQIVTVR